MSTKFTIEVDGVCICFHRYEVWNIIFPCDATHRARLEYPGGTLSDMAEDGKCFEVAFPPDAIDSSFGIGGNFSKLFNMSARYAHETSNGKANINLYQPVSTMIGNIVWIKIPKSTLDGTDPTGQENYYVQDVTAGAGLPVEILDPVPDGIIITFTANRDFTLNAVDLKAASTPKKLLDFKAGSPDILLKIDNDCKANCPTTNDFSMLYNIVYDNNVLPAKRRKFAAGQVKPKPGLSTKSDQGNCDPVSSEPPPDY